MLLARRPTAGRCSWLFLTGRHRSTIWKVLKRHGVSRQRRGRAPADHADAMSGPRPGRCCISTPSSCPSSTGPDTGRTAIAELIARATSGKVKHHRRYRRSHAPGLLRTARRREPAHRLSHPAPRRRVDGSARLRPRAGGHERQRARATPAATSFAIRSPSSARGTSSSRPTRHAGTGRSSASSERSIASGHAAACGRNSTQRDRALSSFIRYYNRRRPHTAANGRPPITRVR